MDGWFATPTKCPNQAIHLVGFDTLLLWSGTKCPSPRPTSLSLFPLLTIKVHLVQILPGWGPLPDELVIVEEGGVFDQAEVLLHPVDKGLDLQVGHLVQWEEADAAKHIK